MKHVNYGALNFAYQIPVFHYIKAFFNANIKTLAFYPKSLWYSQRYNAGEKFLLHNAQFYPNSYNKILSKETSNEPLNVSTKLIVGLNEKFLLDYTSIQNDKNLPDFLKRYAEPINKNISESFKNLDDIVSFNITNSQNLNFPVVVWGRLLYAYAKLGINPQRNAKKIDVVISKFMEKINFADTETISLVLFALAKLGNYKQKTWIDILNALKEKSFSCEFTKVQSKVPFVFRYEEVPVVTSKILDDFNSKLFECGHKEILDVYYALLNAHSNSSELQPLTKKAISHFESKYGPVLKNYQKYTEFI